MGIATVEVNLATHIGDPDTVAVPGDASHHALEQVAVVGVIQGTEAKGVEQSDGTGPHSQYVAHDSANTGSRALKGFHGRGVVVGLHFEDRYDPIPQVHRAGVLRTGIGQHPG